jgi:PII-like signaling protein
MCVLGRGKARKVTVFVSAGDQRDGRPVYELVVERAQARGLAGATVLRGLMGLGADGKVHTAHVTSAHAEVPLQVEIVDSAEMIAAFLPELYVLVDEQLIEQHDVEIIRPAAQPSAGAHMKLEGKARMLRVFIEAVDQWEGEPLHEALVKRLRLLDIAGVTVIRGVMGYGATGRLHRHKMLRHDEPIVLIIVDTPEKIATVMPAIDHMLGGGMAVLSDVDVIFHRPAPA